jgi:hypothetical protein
MAYDGFDNINQLELQAAIEAEIDLFENSRSGPTYTNMEGPIFQPLLELLIIRRQLLAQPHF